MLIYEVISIIYIFMSHLTRYLTMVEHKAFYP